MAPAIVTDCGSFFPSSRVFFYRTAAHFTKCFSYRPARPGGAASPRRLSIAPRTTPTTLVSSRKWRPSCRRRCDARRPWTDRAARVRRKNARGTRWSRCARPGKMTANMYRVGGKCRRRRPSVHRLSVGGSSAKIARRSVGNRRRSAFVCLLLLLLTNAGAFGRLRLLRNVVDVAVPDQEDRGAEQDALGQRGGEGDVLLPPQGPAESTHSAGGQTPMWVPVAEDLFVGCSPGGFDWWSQCCQLSVSTVESVHVLIGQNWV